MTSSFKYHPNGLRLIVVLTLFFVHPAIGDEQAPSLPAESFPFDGGVVVLDKQLLEHSDWVVKSVAKQIDEAKQAQAIDREAIQGVAKQITDACFDLLGYENARELYDQTQLRVEEKLIDAETPVYVLPKHVSVFVLNRDTIKNYLRAGGELPYVKYDELSDSVNYSIKFNFADHSVPLPNMLLIEGFALNDDIGSEFTPEWLTAYIQGTYLNSKDIVTQIAADRIEGLPPRNPAIDLDEQSLIEAAIAVIPPLIKSKTRLGEDQHTQWFVSGMILTLSPLVLEAIGAEREAIILTEIYTKQKPIDQHPFVREWLADGNYLRYTPFKLIFLRSSSAEKVIEQSRRIASTMEFKLLIEHLTLDRLPELLKLIETQQVDSTAILETMIKERFGYNIASRLDAYQPSPSAEANYSALIKEVFAARDAGDIAKMLFYLNRAYEVQVGKGMPDVPGIYRMFHSALKDHVGKAENGASAQVIAAWWSALEQQQGGITDQQTRELAFLWAKDTINSQDLRIGYKLLKKFDNEEVRFEQHVVEGSVMEPILWMIRANKHIDQGELREAQALIDKTLIDRPAKMTDEYFDKLFQPHIDQLQMRINSQRPQLHRISQVARQQVHAAA